MLGVTVALTQLVISLSCSYEGGFVKARSDIRAHAWGYNLDQYCFAESDASKVDYKKGYDAGREHGPRFDEVGLLENPKDATELMNLLRVADQRDKDLRQREEIEALKAQIQKQTQSIDQLQNETSKLKEESSMPKNKVVERLEPLKQ